MATLMQASHQWAVRPDDERFAGDAARGPIKELLDVTHQHALHSKAMVVSSRELSAHPVEGDDKGIVLVRNGNPAVPTHWAWGQLCARAGAPASYLRDLPSPLAADNLNWGFQSREVDEMGILLRSNGQGPTLTAATGPGYGRIWNHQIAKALLDRFGDGRTGDFRVPGEFGKRVEITKANTTVYASDRDMFVFLADEDRRIDVPNRRGGKSGSMARGFFVGNSEVGSATLSIDTFLFDYVCCNRIVWGASDVSRIRIRHTSGAPWRFVEEVAPALEEYAQSSTKSMMDAIKTAKAKQLGTKDKVIEFLSKRFTRTQASAFNMAHEQEEGRPIETLWDAVTGATAYAKRIPHQDARIDIERKAGSLLDLVAA